MHVGRVRVEAFIARGGIGEVYRGFDEVLQRPVALKSIRIEHRMTAIVRARFLREARLLSKLDHPHICRIYDIISEENCDYLVLELIEGKTLREVFYSNINQGERLRIAKEIADALQYAHERQVLHRDLKPDNVMISPSGEVKILDFGLARTFEDEPDQIPASFQHPFKQSDSDKTVQGTILGTLRFMSPEQAAGEELTSASDIYSFGLILQELITEKSAYPSELDGVALYDRVRQAKTLSVSGIDPDLSRLIDRMKNVEPEKRPLAREVVQGLEHVQRKPQEAKQNLRRFVAASILILAIGATAYFSRRQEVTSLKPGQEGRIAMLPFANQTGEKQNDWVTFGLMEMVAETLDQNPQIDVISRDTVLQAVRKNGFDRNTNFSADQISRLCKIVGSQYVASTVIKRERDQYHLHYTVYDVRGLRSSGQITGIELTNMASALSAALNQRLVPHSLLPDLQETYSTSEIANQAYAAGLQRLSTAGPLVAENYFKVCLDLDRDFLWAEKRLAECYERMTRWDDSEKILNKLLTEARNRKERRIEADTLRSLGVIHNHKKDYDTAQTLWNDSLKINRELKSTHEEARILNNLAVVSMNRNDFPKAETLLKQSLSLKKKIGDRLGEAFTLNNLSVVAYNQKQKEMEEKYALESLRISREIADLEAQAYTLGNLGDMYRERRDYSSAVNALKEAWDFYHRMGDKEGEGIASYGLALTYVDLGKLKEAEQYLPTARLWFKDDPRIKSLNEKYDRLRKSSSLR